MEAYTKNWVNSFTLEELKQHVDNNGLVSLSNKPTKLQLVQLLISNNIEKPTHVKRSIKRKLDDEPEKKITKKRKSLPKNKLDSIISKIKVELNEPETIEISNNQINNLMFNDENIVVGKLNDGVLVNLEQADVDYCIGERIVFDKLRIKYNPIEPDNENSVCEPEEEEC